MLFRRKIQRLSPHVARASWAVAEQVFSPLIMIVLTPFLLKQLGIEQYGMWMLVMAVVGMGQLTSLGVATATTKHVSADIAAGKLDEAVAAIQAAITIVLSVGFIICLLFAVSVPFITQVFFSKMGPTAFVSQMILLAVVLMFMQEVDNVFASALRGAQRFDLSAKIEFVTRLVWALGVAFLAWHYRSVVAVIFGVLLLSLVKVCVKAYLVNRIFSSSNCYKPIWERTQLKRVANFGKWAWVQGVGGILFAVADRLIIGSLFGSADLARFSICMQLAQYVHTIPAAAMQVIFPWLSARAVRGQLEDDWIKLYKYALYGGALCLLMPIALYILSPILITLWLGEAFCVENIELARILIVAFALLAFSVPAHYILMGLGKVKFLSLNGLIAGIITVGASMLLSPFGVVWFAASKLLFGSVLLVNLFKLRKPL
jgi:O-antigen/teichoic acid export membrane protein